MTILIIVFITAILVLFSGLHQQSRWSQWLGIFGLCLAFGVSFLPENSFWERYQDMFHFGSNAQIFARISLMATIVIFAFGDFALHRHQNHQSEIYALMLFSLCGALVLLGFQNLTIMFLGIEILSIPIYVLAGSDKKNPKSIEASVKYFLTGAFATGFLLMGIAVIYGSLGSLDWNQLQVLVIGNQGGNMLKIGVLMVLGALGFKVALVPFHFWSPDVYQGSSSLITLFMSSVVKVAGFFTFFEFFRVFPIPTEILYFLTIVSLLVPSILGLVQSDVKRMLAYSSIANVGYLMLIFFGINEQSYHILSFYLWAYTLANIGVFLGLIFVEKNLQNTDFESFKGLAKTHSLLAVMVSISLFSLAGIPFTAGFIGKLNLFLQAFAEEPLLVMVGVIASVVSVVYYLKLIVAMFFYSEERDFAFPLPKIYTFISFLIIIGLIVWGLFPDLFLWKK